jgi:hypothetical protein
MRTGTSLRDAAIAKNGTPRGCRADNSDHFAKLVARTKNQSYWQDCLKRSVGQWHTPAPHYSLDEGNVLAIQTRGALDDPLLGRIIGIKQSLMAKGRRPTRVLTWRPAALRQANNLSRQGLLSVGRRYVTSLESTSTLKRLQRLSCLYVIRTHPEQLLQLRHSLCALTAIVQSYGINVAEADVVRG